jgi:hypothetical protein
MTPWLTDCAVSFVVGAVATSYRQYQRLRAQGQSSHAIGIIAEDFDPLTTKDTKVHEGNRGESIARNTNLLLVNKLLMEVAGLGLRISFVYLRVLRG